MILSQQAESSAVLMPRDKRIDHQTWQLDEAGNWQQFDWQQAEGKNAPRLAHTRQQNTANEITSLSAAAGAGSNARWSAPQYDEAGNMIRMPNPRAPRDWFRCTYDAWNRLAEVRDRGGNVIAAYQYDGLNRRIVKQTKDDQGNQRWRHYFYSADGQVVEERESSKATTLPNVPDRQHFWGTDGQLLFSEHGATNVLDSWSSLSNRLHVLRDALGSTTALMNQASQLAGRFSYQPYGEPRTLNNDFTISSQSPWHAFDYLFAGYRYDHETGLYHTRARQYHPLLGTWTSHDPAGYVDGLNLYQYVAGSPTNFIDPTGEWAWLAVGAIAIGAAFLLAPSAIDPQSEVGVSDEASAAFYKENRERQIAEVGLVASFAVPAVGARTLMGRMTLGGATNVAFQGGEDLITYSMTGQHDYVDAQGNFSASAMATSYGTNFLIGAALPGVGTVLGRGTRWAGQQLFPTRLRPTVRLHLGEALTDEQIVERVMGRRVLVLGRKQRKVELFTERLRELGIDAYDASSQEFQFVYMRALNEWVGDSKGFRRTVRDLVNYVSDAQHILQADVVVQNTFDCMAGASWWRRYAAAEMVHTSFWRTVRPRPLRPRTSRYDFGPRQVIRFHRDWF